MHGTCVEICFQEELRRFVRGRAAAENLRLPRTRRTSVKDLIESRGIPHTEVGSIRIDGRPASDTAIVPPACRIEVFARVPPLIRDGFAPRFALDVHLGRLTAHLRLLGFDSLYRNDWSDAQLAAVAAAQDRWVLTRDRRLLMRRAVTKGHCVWPDAPLDQAREIVQQFGLVPLARPWTRCLRCNGPLQHAPKQDVLPLLPPKTKLYFDRFRRCAGCTAIYWEGSHVATLRHFLSALGVDPRGTC